MCSASQVSHSFLQADCLDILEQRVLERALSPKSVPWQIPELVQMCSAIEDVAVGGRSRSLLARTRAVCRAAIVLRAIRGSEGVRWARHLFVSQPRFHKLLEQGTPHVEAMLALGKARSGQKRKRGFARGHGSRLRFVALHRVPVWSLVIVGVVRARRGVREG